MAQVSVSIAGRNYRMACDDGEEGHLTELAVRLDAKITELRGHFGEIGDQRLTVMAALTIADDLSRADRKIDDLESDVKRLSGLESDIEARVAAAGETVAGAIEEAARRIERVARHLDSVRRS